MVINFFFIKPTLINNKTHYCHRIKVLILLSNNQRLIGNRSQNYYLTFDTSYLYYSYV